MCCLLTMRIEPWHYPVTLSNKESEIHPLTVPTQQLQQQQQQQSQRFFIISLLLLFVSFNALYFSVVLRRIDHLETGLCMKQLSANNPKIEVNQVSNRLSDKRAVSQHSESCDKYDPLQSLVSRENPVPPRAMNELFEGPGLLFPSAANKTSAACEFYRAEWSKHFPHAMQQLYSCVSWWLAHPEAALYLIGPQESHPGFRPRPVSPQTPDFLQGFTWALQDVYNVTMVATHTAASTNLVPVRVKNLEIIGPVQQEEYYRMASSPGDMKRLSQDMLGFYNISRPACREQPRIAILNRKKENSRTLLNANKIAKDMTSMLGQEVTVHYFENYAFLDQIEFYASYDLIITPHGAQVVGMPFMPQCGGILEIFPPGYDLHNFFGSLADTAGIQYYSIYSGGKEADPLAETQDGLQNLDTAVQARKVNFCLNPGALIQAVETMIGDWRRCCSRQ